uniref:Protein HflC n=1 Tax=Magnetococcus massalia (strain MO-1) TaxID=451514 RepID=A0A1S7LHM9_MAGMO|nr:Protease activity modulator HflK [Candidatus Magnetococcus massalia]
MNNNLSSGILLLAGVVLLLLSQSAFTIHQVEQALVVQLGKPVRPITEPGLHFKVPFMQNVLKFDSRLLDYDQDPQEVLSSDKKNLRVDNYARWRISDPLKFYQTVRNERNAVQRLHDIIDSNLREELGQHTMMTIVAKERDILMASILKKVNIQADKFGMEIKDVRIKRTDLPPENSKAVFRRMQTERERQAKQYRAEGEEEAVKIRSDADRQREILLATAYKESQELRGMGDGEAARIYAEAYNKDPKFYQFFRTMEAYRKSIGENNTTVVFKPEGFFESLKALNTGM